MSKWQLHDKKDCQKYCEKNKVVIVMYVNHVM